MRCIYTLRLCDAGFARVSGHSNVVGLLETYEDTTLLYSVTEPCRFLF